MSTDKRKPIPSPKHTLDDVLKTLQDLVRNELADEHVGRGRPPRAAPRARGDFDDDARTTPPAASPSPELSIDTAAARTTVAAQADTDVAFSSMPAADESAKRAEADAAALGADVGDVEMHDDGEDGTDLRAELSTLFADDTTAVSAAPSDASERIDTTRGAEIAAAHDDSSAHADPEQTSINWDDIPVLNEVVDLPTQAAAAAPNARTVAVRVVARLNIELRKAGTAPLDPAIIDRLEHLLREALDPSAEPSEQ